MTNNGPVYDLRRQAADLVAGILLRDDLPVEAELHCLAAGQCLPAAANFDQHATEAHVAIQRAIDKLALCAADPSCAAAGRHLSRALRECSP